MLREIKLRTAAVHVERITKNKFNRQREKITALKLMDADVLG
jgi:hypothetical protein